MIWSGVDWRFWVKLGLNFCFYFIIREEMRVKIRKCLVKIFSYWIVVFIGLVFY